MGSPVKLTTLPYGDVAFMGRSATGEPLPVGIELKRLGDLLSCIVDHRLTGHQLPGLQAHYERIWLIVEGLWRPGADGEILAFQKGKWWPVKQPVTYRGMQAYLHSLEVLGGVGIRFSSSTLDTAYIIHSLYQWWQRSSHRSLFAFDESRMLRRGGVIELSKPGPISCWAKELPHIGQKRAREAGKIWESPRELATASVEKLRERFKISEKWAKDIERWIGGGK